MRFKKGNLVWWHTSTGFTLEPPDLGRPLSEDGSHVPGIILAIEKSTTGDDIIHIAWLDELTTPRWYAVRDNFCPVEPMENE